MKKICFVFALFCLLFFAVSCDSGIKFDNPKDQHNADKQDSGDTEQSDDSDPIDSEPEDTDTDDDSDTTPEEPDNGDSQPDDDADSSDTEDDDTDSGDTADEDYTEDITDTGTETGETRVQDCSDLPENAQWNTVSAIVQSWDGEKWVPSSKTSFNLEGSEDECRFKCSTNYGWDGSKCDADTRNVYCDNLPEHAQWNDGGRNGTFPQTWNGEDWTPASYDSSYSQTEGTCKYKCDTGYAWNNGVCETASTRTAACQSKPANTEWNTVSEITQTYTGSGWQPSTTPVYNITPSESECRYKCASGYNWNGNSCTDQSPSGTLTLGNICTGQNRCYNNTEEITCPTSSNSDFFGQDAYYASLGECIPQTFTVQTISSQKVVIDNNTGLMWQQTFPTSTYTWAKAISYCDDLTYAGYSDWRLPNPQELLTIVDNSRYKPAIDTTYFPDTPNDYFWSSSTYADYTDSAWRVGFDYGYVDTSYSFNKTNYYYVRCVR